MSAAKKVVTLGGGTGTVAVISALKQLHANISAVVAVSDSGGSSGRIRDEFGFQPVGDLRQSLAALADPKEQEWIRKILLYRFDKGSGLRGHNLGNLILTALQDMTEDTTRSLEIVTRAFNLRGRVIPVTEQTVDLQIEYSDGSSAVGEHILDELPEDAKTIESVTLVPDCTVNQAAHDALTSADYIIIGPGDLYASIMATLVVPGVAEAIKQSNAQVIYISNLMTRYTQTHGMSAKDHVNKIESVLGRTVDTVLLNTEPIPTDVQEYYESYQEYPVPDDFEPNNPKIFRTKLLSTTLIKKTDTDTSYRSLLRHDPNKLLTALESVLQDK